MPLTMARGLGAQQSNAGGAGVTVAQVEEVILSQRCARFVGQSGITRSTTGLTSEVVLQTVVVPAGLMKANGRLHIEHSWGFSASLSAKDLYVRLGGAMMFHIQTANILHKGGSFVTNIQNVNSQAIQKGDYEFFSGITGLIDISTAILNGAIDTSLDQNLTFCAKTAFAADSVQLHKWSVEVFPMA